MVALGKSLNELHVSKLFKDSNVNDIEGSHRKIQNFAHSFVTFHFLSGSFIKLHVAAIYIFYSIPSIPAFH